MLEVQYLDHNSLPGYQPQIYQSPVYSPIIGSSVNITEENTRNMPVDFQSYLLAASPPGFDIHYAMRDFSRCHISRQDRKSPDHIIPVCVSADRIKRPATWDCASSLMRGENNCRPIVKSNSADALLLKTEKLPDESKKIEGYSIPNKLGIGKKKVSFADDLGRQLVHIRILHESSDCPPRLRPELISALTNGSTAEVTDTPPLKLNFAQPASDYVAFRQKIESNCVSLENVILKDYSLMGTIKVKNISFEKNVNVRYSSDGWETFEDTVATYVPTASNSSMPFDTFSFEVKISPKMDINKTLEFAVLYETGNNQFWDNNGGSNYEVVPADWKESATEDHNTTVGVVFGLGSSDSWSTFCGWNNMSNSVPYY